MDSHLAHPLYDSCARRLVAWWNVLLVFFLVLRLASAQPSLENGLLSSHSRDDLVEKLTELIHELITEFREGDELPGPPPPGAVRLASFNAALVGENPKGQEGSLFDMLVEGSEEISLAAETIQRVRPDILALKEFDYDPSGETLDLFKEKYLEVPQADDVEGISYTYSMQIVSNTGVLSRADLNNDGNISLPDDGYGFGFYPGQFAFAILSVFPFDEKAMRSWRLFKWKDMPGNRIRNTNPPDYYSPEAVAELRLSSKNHIDLPVAVTTDDDEYTFHMLVSHPTPPAFDQPFLYNVQRNADEIRLWIDYLDVNATYLVDDRGRRTKGLADLKANFAVFGDQNNDPNGGDGINEVIERLIEHPRIARFPTPASLGGLENNDTSRESIPPAFHTADFALRVDYVLPSKTFNVLKSEVIWPSTESRFNYLVNASDHRMVYADVRRKKK
ncbi:unnamed protein product [Vitrella brassicaformis CCMP3155]|uniref:Endonuclease/exonuclease/phosphatase domain-containing protein n=2 Tax=Vitrella brassicaformis TaxID=1169539 RepID=A0A0G4EJC4_VITBC|nr:unnamed protein product [Vitrella brassicaformis CCMP3155]|eukprot:CEL96333.1 unnamed protein product [Vitrella brassicaformis CCMP3155]